MPMENNRTFVYSTIKTSNIYEMALLIFRSLEQALMKRSSHDSLTIAPGKQYCLTFHIWEIIVHFACTLGSTSLQLLSAIFFLLHDRLSNSYQKGKERKNIRTVVYLMPDSNIFGLIFVSREYVHYQGKVHSLETSKSSPCNNTFLTSQFRIMQIYYYSN